MRLVCIIVFTFLSSYTFSQDKALLQKQLALIMSDFPNKFKALEKKTDAFHLKFKISGTEGEAMILNSNDKALITAYLPTPVSDTGAKEAFEKWATLLDQIDLNGAALVPVECANGPFGLYCKKWKIDNSNNDIDPLYLPFTIEINFIKMRTAYAAALHIGN
jgi:hypothetical protein